MLIVDDDESTIILLSDFFESQGYKCMSALSGESALELIYQGIDEDEFFEEALKMECFLDEEQLLDQHKRKLFKPFYRLKNNQETL